MNRLTDVELRPFAGICVWIGTQGAHRRARTHMHVRTQKTTKKIDIFPLLATFSCNMQIDRASAMRVCRLSDLIFVETVLYKFIPTEIIIHSRFSLFPLQKTNKKKTVRENISLYDKAYKYKRNSLANCKLNKNMYIYIYIYYLSFKETWIFQNCRWKFQLFRNQFTSYLL